MFLWLRSHVGVLPALLDVRSHVVVPALLSLHVRSLVPVLHSLPADRCLVDCMLVCWLAECSLWTAQASSASDGDVGLRRVDAPVPAAPPFCSPS